MREIQPYFTADGSVGLYNTSYSDIYHSADGALSEAYEKFTDAVDWQNLLKNKDIKVLDLCYGIGYNTKSFLNYFYELKNQNCNRIDNIETIYTHKSNCQNNEINNVSIYNDNTIRKIHVTAVDNDEFLILISPFIKTGVKNFSNKNLPNDIYRNISKYLNKKNVKIFNKINPIINYKILIEIWRNYPDIYNNDPVIQALFNNKNKAYFDNDLKQIFRNYLLEHNILHRNTNIFSFLHNIYYNHISNKYKNKLNNYILQHTNIDFVIDDIRNFIKQDSNLYNLIFLDAFSPTKCPCLWTYDFFKALYDRLSPDGQIITYSKAAVVRAAMTEAGFYIGNNYNNKKHQIVGTIAVKNPDLVKYHLSEFDSGLLKTKAGIFYRDENLTAQNEAIIERRKSEVENSDRISASKYIKTKNV